MRSTEHCHDGGQSKVELPRDRLRAGTFADGTEGDETDVVLLPAQTLELTVGKDQGLVDDAVTNNGRHFDEEGASSL